MKLLENNRWILIFCMIAVPLLSCDDDSNNGGVDPDCDDVNTVKPIADRGACTETLAFTNQVDININGNQRIITSNAIPDHMVGLFGNVMGSLNPNAIAPVNDTYAVTTQPAVAASSTALLNTNSGPEYEFGILLNGVILDPEAAEPWPHDGLMSMSTKNWEWNLDAMSVNLGLDCNNAHVQPTGKYHHHGSPTLYLESLGATPNTMTLVGYAADGFPIYYRYGYDNANDSGSPVVSLTPSFQLKSGDRPGDGVTAPCGPYSGIYTNDYEFVNGLGDLDECNGRTGVTPEFPGGTYYYVITDTFPFLPRCLMGTPSNDFRMG